MFPLIDNGKIHLLEEEKNSINITFDLPFIKFKKIEFKINEKKKNDLEKINELYNIVITQNKEINELKNKMNIIENKQNDLSVSFSELKNKMEILENGHKQILNKKKFEDNIMIYLNSSIFKSLDEIVFILERLKNKEKLKNRRISMDLLFKATRDGLKSSDFHRNCDGKVQVLIFIKTTEGEIFGGYTKEGFKSRNDLIKDDEAFVFSFCKKKIYNSKKNANCIDDSANKGPCFWGEVVL